MINRFCRIGLLSLSVLLVACGGGGGGGDAINPQTGAQTTGTTDVGNAATREGTLSLKWVAPTARSNGDALALSEIASYTIYFGTTRGDYPYSVAIADATTTSAVIPDLPLGTYYLVITTTDSQGRESGYSSVAVRKVT